MNKLMFNTATFNDQLLNTWPLPLNLTTDDIEFNWYSLQNVNIISQTIDYDSYPEVDLRLFELTRNHWGWVLGHYFRKKSITITGTLTHDTAEDLNTLIFEFKKNLRVTEWYLDIKVSWITRRTKATVTTLEMPREHYNITFLPFAVTFETVEPFFYEKNRIGVTYPNITSNLTEEVTNLWNIVSNPIFYLLFTSASATNSISVWNGSQTITLSETINTWDVIKIDWENKTVELNWTEIDYTGTFPELEVWSNSLFFTINGTFDCDITVLYRKNLL